MTIQVEMVRHNETPKHSTRFNFSSGVEVIGLTEADKPVDPAFKPSFYVPMPYFRNAKRIRVTIEEI